jgi:hypothetical protein
VSGSLWTGFIPDAERVLLLLFLITRAARFEFKGKDPKFRIETPSRVIHSLKTSVTQEISGMQKQQMQGAIIRVIKRFGTSPPQNVSIFDAEKLPGIRQKLIRIIFRNCFERSKQSFCAGVLSRKMCVAVNALLCFSRRLANYTCQAFQDNVETLLTEGKIIRADADAGTLRIAGGNTAAGGAAAGGT